MTEVTDTKLDMNFRLTANFNDPSGRLTTIDHTFVVPCDVTTHQMGERFADFLRAVGFHFDTYVPVVNGEARMEGL